MSSTIKMMNTQMQNTGLDITPKKDLTLGVVLHISSDVNTITTILLIERNLDCISTLWYYSFNLNSLYSIENTCLSYLAANAQGILAG